MKKHKKSLSLMAFVLLLPALLLSGCGKTEDPFQVIFAAPFVNEKVVADYGEKLALETEVPVKFSGFSFNSQDVDPMAYGAGAMMMTAMVAAGEIDVMVCDLKEAARYARSGAFYDLNEVFTEEELAEVSDRLVSFDIVDEFGNPTGEKTGQCGLDLSGDWSLNYVAGSDSFGAFIVCSTNDMETAKEVFWAIVNS